MLRHDWSFSTSVVDTQPKGRSIYNLPSCCAWSHFHQCQCTWWDLLWILSIRYPKNGDKSKLHVVLGGCSFSCEHSWNFEMITENVSMRNTLTNKYTANVITSSAAGQSSSLQCTFWACPPWVQHCINFTLDAISINSFRYISKTMKFRMYNKTAQVYKTTVFFTA